MTDQRPPAEQPFQEWISRAEVRAKECWAGEAPGADAMEDARRALREIRRLQAEVERLEKYAEDRHCTALQRLVDIDRTEAENASLRERIAELERDMTVWKHSRGG